MMSRAEGQGVISRSMAAGAIKSVTTQDSLRRLAVRFDHFGDHRIRRESAVAARRRLRGSLEVRGLEQSPEAGVIHVERPAEAAPETDVGLIPGEVLLDDELENTDRH